MIQTSLSRNKEHILESISTTPTDMGLVAWDQITKSSVCTIRKALLNVPTPTSMQLKHVEVNVIVYCTCKVCKLYL